MPPVDPSESIAEFLAGDPDEDACLDYLWRRHQSTDGHHAVCPHCEETRRFHRAPGRRWYSCDSCGHHVHPTAGTILHRSSTPLVVWFRAIACLTRDDPPASVKELAAELGTPYKTALRINRLVQMRLAAGTPGGSVLRPLPRAGRAQLDLEQRPSDEGQLATLAGSGAPAWNVRIPAHLAQLNVPYGVAFDSDGVLHVSDFEGHVVRAVGTDGMMTTIAGDGVPGYRGDGGPAHLSRLNHPAGLAVDASGALLIADTRNHRVRRVSHDGTISTVAGCGRSGLGGDGGLATNAHLSAPYVVLAAGDEIYVSEYRGHCVRRVDRHGVISTIAGNGSWVTTGDGGSATVAGVPMPSGLAIDDAGCLYIAQSANRNVDSRVRRIDADGQITTFAGTGVPGDSGDGGPATEAEINNPCGLLYDSVLGLLLCDHLNHRVRRVDHDGTISTIVGNGARGFAGDGAEPTAGSLDQPCALALHDRTLAITDSNNHRVRAITLPPR